MLACLKESAVKLEGLNSASWKRVPLKEFLSPVRNEAMVSETTIYKQVTVKLYGKGAVLRKILPGHEIRTRPQFIVKTGQLIMSRIDARNGAFAIVPSELDGAVVTQDFPLFQVDRNWIEPEFLAVLLRSHGFLDACKRASRGTTNRKRLKEAILLDELVPLPNQDVQRLLVELTRQLESLGNEVDCLHLAASSAIPAVANSIFG
jgi:restriction endonuclease S subunit